MLELPPAAAEELARTRAEQMADLPFVFEIYANSIAADMRYLTDMDSETRSRMLRSILLVSTDAVKLLKEEYK